MSFKRLKLSYALYNFFHKKELEHNIPIYKKLGINKSYYSPVSSKDFKDITIEESTKSIADEIKKTRLYQTADEETKISLDNYENNGFSILNSFVPSDTVDAINKEIDEMLANGETKFSYINKIMFAIEKSATLRNLGTDEELQEVLDVLIDGKAKLFQSINFLTGSQQKTHSDSIHMTTFPLGGLLGVWIALEDIDIEQGALHYFPGSHKLPYYLNGDYDNEGSFLLIGDKDYTAYEEMLEKKVQELKLEKKIFSAKKGDLLIWHANLLHGGEPHTDTSKTRKSMVFHYFKEGSVCYHEITQRPALIKKH